MKTYELEVKSKQPLCGFFSCTCDKPGVFLVEIGFVGYVHGTFFRTCGSEECLEDCFDEVEARILAGDPQEPDIESIKLSA